MEQKATKHATKGEREKPQSNICPYPKAYKEMKISIKLSQSL